jgi:hypothetical protein
MRKALCAGVMLFCGAALPVVAQSCDVDASNGTVIEPTVGFEIKNTSSAAMRVAMKANDSTLQLEGGYHLEHPTISGIATDLGFECLASAKQYAAVLPGERAPANLRFRAHLGLTDLRPIQMGRLAGLLTVYSSETGKCWKVPFSANRIPVNVNRQQ